ncbi:uncharacterized protein CIMG_02674 [Coccidioides immitis RS]|uniref:Aminoglycoside phosphotransferase domain-containing protein n=1 Tax=Coccidioides immitis RMSCC 2394 TaxID=404692 RepID=A0A0J6Y390_COCIT|nr:uncharacterized protein CIMG_02674 [Coccidioides immitis RS]EAS37320.3 hypothetical protein CIMG_02674 [Coccidioides immitis RS]KMP02205.1 hypothetical protein CIRG_10028 [Coccidioides immitis RMSCC 2394]TPX24717.1 hypothetical protein DIZ76_010152 [Coccidioides immitis]
MSRFASWQTGVSFVFGASISLLVSFLAFWNRERAFSAGLSESKTKDATPFNDETFCGDDDGDLRKALTDLNESVMMKFQHELQKTVSWADLSLLFTRWARLYPSTRHMLVQKRSLKSQDCRGSSSQKPLRFNDLLSVPQAQLEILRPLAPEVTALLRRFSEEEGDPSDHGINSALSKALKGGEVIWSHFARAVVQLDHRVVVKLGPNISLTDADMTTHIQRNSTDIPVPRPLGVLSLGGITYAFMRRIDGCSLDKLWPDLTDVEKCSVRDQLDFILEKLRLLPAPNQYLGGGSPPQCVDCRMWKRTSPLWMESETQFNEFLLSGNCRSGMEPYVNFIRPMLRENHRFVLTHGDLHPRNILAVKDGGGIRVTGLIDWEVGGVYPEYWEFVKSLNTVRPIRSGDWPFYLPLKGIGRYFEEYAIDCLIDNCVT